MRNVGGVRILLVLLLLIVDTNYNSVGGVVGMRRKVDERRVSGVFNAPSCHHFSEKIRR